ncbi:hypothetical protein [Wenjunlia tyrosinilytica]|uniref:hypothetical protein n=1 Tax=Wenjunlia tyrosinilytica TaxID=1544741 RepID=UPI00166B9810|nr:hypothetical protein [Wenjunlia tyrosinilytica]
MLSTKDYRDQAHWKWTLRVPGGPEIEHDVDLSADCDLVSSLAAPYSRLAAEGTARGTPSWSAAERQLGREIGERVLGEAICERLLQWASNRPKDRVSPVLLELAPDTRELAGLPLSLATTGPSPSAPGRSEQMLADRRIRFIHCPPPVAGPSQDLSDGSAADGQALPVCLVGVFSSGSHARADAAQHEEYILRRRLLGVAVGDRMRLTLRNLVHEVGEPDFRRSLSPAGAHSPTDPSALVLHIAGRTAAGPGPLTDTIGGKHLLAADKVAQALGRGRDRLGLVVLSSPPPGTPGMRERLARLGIEPGGRDVDADTPEPAAVDLPWQLAETLECPVLSFRYPIPEGVIAEICGGLYTTLLTGQDCLPDALEQVLDGLKLSGLDRCSPTLYHPKALGLRLRCARGDHGVSGRLDFVSHPDVLRKAGAVLDAGSPHRGVLLHGIESIGKRACVHALRDRYEHLFHLCVPFDAARTAMGVQSALFAFYAGLSEKFGLLPEWTATKKRLDSSRSLQDFDRELDVFNRMLNVRCANRRALIALLNADWLTDGYRAAGQWRYPPWGRLIRALVDHEGLSRLVITSARAIEFAGRRPGETPRGDRIKSVAVHPLTAGQSLTLAGTESMRNLSGFVLPGAAGHVPGWPDEERRSLVRRLIESADGHPGLLRLAEKEAGSAESLDAFLKSVGRNGEDSRKLTEWTKAFTENALGGQVEADAARLLLWLLCALEDNERFIPGPSRSSGRAPAAGPARGSGTVLARLWAGICTEPVPRLRPLLSNGGWTVPPDPPGGEASDDFARWPELAVLTVGTPPLDWLLNTALVRCAEDAHGGTRLTIQRTVAEAALETAPEEYVRELRSRAAAALTWALQDALRSESYDGRQTVLRHARALVPYLVHGSRSSALVDVAEVILERDPRILTNETVRLALRDAFPEQMREIEEASDERPPLSPGRGPTGRWHRNSERITWFERLRDRLEIPPRSEGQGSAQGADLMAAHRIGELRAQGDLAGALAEADRCLGQAREGGADTWRLASLRALRARVGIDAGDYKAAAEEAEDVLLDSHSWDGSGRGARTTDFLRAVLRDATALCARYCDDAVTRQDCVHDCLDVSRRAAKKLTKRLEYQDALESEQLRAYVHGCAVLMDPPCDQSRQHVLRHIQECYDLAEGDGDWALMGQALSAKAEVLRGRNPGSALTSELGALRFHYLGGTPMDIARCHENIGRGLGPDVAGDQVRPSGALVHHLAAALIRRLTGDGRLPDSLSSLDELLLASAPSLPRAVRDLEAAIGKSATGPGELGLEEMVTFLAKEESADAALAALVDELLRRQEGTDDPPVT